MRRQRLLHQGGARARKSQDEDRLGDVAAHARARQRLQALGDEEAAQPVDEALRVLVQIGVAAQLAAEALALLEGREGLEPRQRLRWPKCLLENRR